MREADQHVDGRRCQIPGFDHGDPRLEQTPAATGRAHDAREHDPVRPAGNDGVDQFVFTSSAVPSLAKCQMVASIGEIIGQRLPRFLENG